jgi:mRNA interferase MazF
MRPAIVLADAGRGDWILCQVTSNPYGDARVITLGDKEFKSGSLRITSYARPGKLFTANESLIAESVGVLKNTAINELISAVIALFRESVPE